MAIQTTYSYNYSHGYAGDVVFNKNKEISVRNAETTLLGFGLFVFRSAFTSTNGAMGGQGIRYDVALPNATTIDSSLLLVTKRCNLWGVPPNNGLGYNPVNRVNDAYIYGYPTNYAVEAITEGVIYVQVSSDVADSAVLTPSTLLYVETAAGADRGRLSITAGATKIALPLSVAKPQQARINVVEGQRTTAIFLGVN
jgi:hypothetical protein